MPIQSIYERFVQLSAIKYVDEILVYDSENSLLDLLESTPIDIRFVGDDYKNKNFTGKGIGKTFFTSRKTHIFYNIIKRNVYKRSKLMLKIEEKKIKEVKENIENPRKHNSKQVEQIANSISEFGFTNPILVDKNLQIIAGHGRYLAAKKIKNVYCASYSSRKSYRTTNKSFNYS